MSASGRETVRLIALGVASVVLIPIAVLLLDKRGLFDSFPNWLVGMFIIVPVIIYLWWLATHDPVKNKLKLRYNRRPKMLLALLIIFGASIGGVLGAFEWWIIAKSDAKADAKAEPSPTPSTENRPGPLLPSPMSSATSTISPPAPSTTISPQQTTPTPVAKVEPKADDATIIGRIDEAYFHTVPTPAVGGMVLYVVMKVHIANQGVSTKVQDFRLAFSYFGQEYRNDKFSLADFRMRCHISLNETVPVVLADLEDSNAVLFERQKPRDGWLCFRVYSVPVFLPNDDVALKGVRLQVNVIDGADQAHPISANGPFQRPCDLTAVGQL